MLSELRIQNFAIIDRLDIQFAAGFNVITGETGAGKSIMIDAVDMMLGGRADSTFIRAGQDKAVVEGVFRLPASLQTPVRETLEREGIEMQAPDEVTLTRELRSNGRNVCRLNGTTVSLQFYRDIGQQLVDIHGQSDHLSLLRQQEHLHLLDRYAGLESQRAALAALVGELTALRREIGQLEQDEAAIARRIDMLNYQIQEIRAVAPKIGEEEPLQEESTRLSNAEHLAELAAESLRLLDSEEPDTFTVIDMLNQLSAALGKAAKLDTALEDNAALAETLVVQAEEIARSLRHYHENLEPDSARLNEIEDRLDALNRLKKKYGGDIPAVLEFAEKAQQELDKITHSEERLAELRAAEETLLRRIGEAGQKISAARVTAADQMARAIEVELGDLRMEGTRFSVLIEQIEDSHGAFVGDRRLRFDATGIDRVEFLLAANRGEPLRPLVKVASGGETARIMLALKTVLSRADPTPTLIFDEIDQGIGGRVGSTVGQKLWQLSGRHQVLCVTHLAHLAGFADAHFRVTKELRGERTVALINPLNDKARVDEIAEMLGAETVSAKQSAYDILMLARQVKEGNGFQPALL
ncbi:MAG: DNA repair protein RecN [Anaerolineae bacterium]|nr:DNA repair protein RecN [Anaerolineae bacterium]